MRSAADNANFARSGGPRTAAYRWSIPRTGLSGVGPIETFVGANSALCSRRKIIIQGPLANVGIGSGEPPQPRIPNIVQQLS